MKETKHACKEFRWEMCVNEAGWICIDCDQPSQTIDPPGFDPFLDKKQINEKVGDILMHLHETKVVYISNGSSGDVLTGMVANRCRNENRYDQDSIVRFIVELEHAASDYWRRIGMGIREGNDPRDRCYCGKLASCWSGGNHYCSNHIPSLTPAPGAAVTEPA